MKVNQEKLENMKNEPNNTRGVHSLLYFAYMCILDLFIGGLFTLQKRL